MTLSEFNDELVAISGRNTFGQPLLRAVDARTEETWVAGSNRLKYVGETKEDGTEVGQECVVIEMWRSPEFLAATGRFPSLQTVTTTTVTFICRSCLSQVPHRPGSEEMDVKRVCLICGSSRVSPVYEREEEAGGLLPELPSEGHYDYFLRVSFADLANRAGDILNTVKAVWAFQKLPLNEQNRLIDEHEEKVKKERAKRQRERLNAQWGFDLNDYEIIQTSDGRVRPVRKPKEI